MIKRLIVASVAATALGLAFIAPSAGASVSVGHSGWSWGNPLPQGNTLRALDFAGGRGFAAGDFGTLLRTDDAGATWSGVPTGITADLKRVSVVDSNTIVIAGGCTARRSDDGGQTFHRLPFSNSDINCPAQISSFSFPTPQAGFLLLQDGTVLSSADGGQTFSRQTAVPGTPATGAGTPATPADIFFTSPTVGYVITRGAGGGKIYRTTNGGAAWTLVTTAGANLNALWFENAGTGYAVGDGKTLVATTDGGDNWAAKPLGGVSGGNFGSIRCVGSTCILATVDGATLVRTTDGGGTGSEVSPSSQRVYVAGFASPTRVVAVGEAGSTVASDDGGQNFSPIGARLAGSFFELVATSGTVAWAPGANGSLARTTNGGQSWSGGGVPTSEDVVDVSFPDGSNGYALDSSGSLFKTTNGGGSWALLDTGTSATPPSVLALDANRVLLVGPQGVRRSTDGGQAFSRINAKPVRNANLDSVDHVGSTVFVYGSKAAYFSTNGGAKWQQLKLPQKRFRVNDLDFTTSKAGYVLESNGRLWFTKNRGAKWTQLVGTGTLDVVGIDFSSTKTGFLVIRRFGFQTGGLLLRTSDAGHTWRPQLVSRNSINDLSLVSSGGTDYVRDNANNMFFTRTGGDLGTASSLRLKTKKTKLTKASTIKVTGKLPGAQGGEQVVVSARSVKGGWVHKVVQVASNDSFSTVWKVRRDTIFVAQWLGDADHNGAGSKVLGVSFKK
ncbi:MAG TPA: hypothetical protein VF752_16255 [Thermoleophilaceae bacterium]